MREVSSNIFGITFIVLIICGVLRFSPASAGSRENFTYSQSCQLQGTFLDCSNLALSTVPEDIPQWIETLKLTKNLLTKTPNFRNAANLSDLNLAHNKIAVLNFDAERMVNLKSLELNNNHVSEIARNSFHGVPSLEILNLNSNNISSLDDACFEGLRNLIDLKLNRNKLTSVNKEAFKWLNNLIALVNGSGVINFYYTYNEGREYLMELNRNQIFQINGLTFQGMERLSILKIRQNLIEDLDDGAFYGLWNLRELHLDFNRLSRISKGWLYGLESLVYLNVSYNKIEYLNNGWESCPHLIHLDISNNKLQFLEKANFDHLGKLQTLKLDNNRISYIEDSSFSDLFPLLLLDLSNNQVSWIVENANGVFKELKKVTKLHLAGNKISVIGENAFIGMQSLSQLDLMNNAIVAVEENPFNQLTALKEIMLNTSSLICDCYLTWFITWLSQSQVQITRDTMKCTYPPHLKKKSLHNIRTTDLICMSNDNPRPTITWHPVDVVSLVGDNVTLRCGANSSVDSDITFVWKRNNYLLENVRSHLHSLNKGQAGGGASYYSELQLDNLQMEQSGLYQCVASNYYGVSYSSSAKLSVLIFPSFAKVPSNLTVNLGGTAKLECAGLGYPSPLITWQKDGASEFPAARERRMKIMTANDPFFIVNVKLYDAGVYTCVARNAAGAVVTNATLQVLEPPTLRKDMENKEVVSGEPALMECLVSGWPKPNMTWYKDGSIIEMTQRVHLTDDDRLLVITNTLPSDEGNYRCEFSNSLGANKALAHLSVISKSESFFLNDTTILCGAAIGACVVGLCIIWLTIINGAKREANHGTRVTLSAFPKEACGSEMNYKDPPSPHSQSVRCSYQDLLTNPVAGRSGTGSQSSGSSSDRSPNVESVQPLMTTFHPVSSDTSSIIVTWQDSYSSSSVRGHSSCTLPHPSRYATRYCISPTSSAGTQCTCLSLSSTFNKCTHVCESPIKRIANQCGERDSCYGTNKRRCSTPIPRYSPHLDARKYQRCADGRKIPDNTFATRQNCCNDF